MSARELAEEELARRAIEVEEMMLGDLVEQFFADLSFDSRKSAEGMAERLEAFAVDANLEGREYSGTIATKVVQRDDGDWTVEISYLSQAGRKWRSIRWKGTKLPNNRTKLQDNRNVFNEGLLENAAL